jgi:hypothetical protein
MAFPGSVLAPGALPFGVVGELFLHGPLRAQPVRLNSADAANNVVGRALSVVTGGDGVGNPPEVTAGGAGAFAGILANPKVYVSGGTTVGGALAPTLVLPNNTIAEAVTEGEIIVQFATASAVGDDVYYLTATGVLNRVAHGAAAPANSTGPIGRVVRFTNAAASLAVVHVIEGVNPPAA